MKLKDEEHGLFSQIWILKPESPIYHLFDPEKVLQIQLTYWKVVIIPALALFTILKV